MTTETSRPTTPKTDTSQRRIAIIGGGAAGLMAAITAARSGVHVTLFEYNDTVGKKILASGNGRCNISNEHLTIDDYFGIDPAFVAPSLNGFGFAAFKKFCQSIGLLLRTHPDGRTYPLSNTATSVATALYESAKSAGVTFHCGVMINRIESLEFTFRLYHDATHYGDFDRVLIATGSEAAPQLGSNASGMKLAEALGHTLYPTYPSLVALELEDPYHHKMSGLKQEAEVTLYLNNQAVQTVHGDILFTRYGISGFAILDISQKASEALALYMQVTLGIKLLPDFERQSLSDQITRLCHNVPSHTVETMLGGFISPKIARQLLAACDINAATPASALSTKMIKKIANLLCDWRFQVSGTHGFKHAEVSGGGIATAEVDATTMESQKVKGIYFAGEILDIVGKRGGYNLHFAWASGYLAGKAMSQS